MSEVNMPVNETEVPEVRMPVKTTVEGEKITKVCVEDIYKILNRTIESINKAYDKSMEILDAVHKDCDDYEGELIVGTGVSQPCSGDKFDEKIGNDIAFMKMKLNANIKKHNLLVKVLSELNIAMLRIIKDDLQKIDDNILYDLDGIRKYNPDYLPNLEYKLGIY